MPRGVKKERNYSDEIAQIEAKITEYESKIKVLKSQLTSLKKEKEKDALRQLNKLLDESGLTVDEISNMIKQK